jgi:hypothetical protein
MATTSEVSFGGDLKDALSSTNGSVDLPHFAFLLSHQLMPINDKFHAFYR